MVSIPFNQTPAAPAIDDILKASTAKDPIAPESASFAEHLTSASQQPNESNSSPQYRNRERDESTAAVERSDNEAGQPNAREGSSSDEARESDQFDQTDLPQDQVDASQNQQGADQEQSEPVEGSPQDSEDTDIADEHPIVLEDASEVTVEQSPREADGKQQILAHEASGKDKPADTPINKSIDASIVQADLQTAETKVDGDSGAAESNPTKKPTQQRNQLNKPPSRSKPS